MTNITEIAATTEQMHATIAMHGVHTNAVGERNQWNKGTAYCDQCEDETLVIQTPLPTSVIRWH